MVWSLGRWISPPVEAKKPAPPPVAAPPETPKAAAEPVPPPVEETATPLAALPFNGTVDRDDIHFQIVPAVPPAPPPVQPHRGVFIETQSGFLRLELVQRFEIRKAGQLDLWLVDAFLSDRTIDQVGTFPSEAEARDTVARLIGG